VYAGVGVVEGWNGDRWRRAVETTSDEILLYEGSPAQALYSSTSSGRTRNVEDIFPGASPTPYLVAVESPGEDSPFVQWSFTLDRAEMELLLADAGLLEGRLVDVETELTEDGDGSWTVVIVGTEGTSSIGTWELRTELNAAAARVLPERLPVMRPDVDRPYPQTILSPTFTIERRFTYFPPRGGLPRIEAEYLIRGGGWGHSTGMSQFGAEAMATRGSDHSEILAHYYGGLTPAVSDQLPDAVVVGLKTEERSIEVSSDGPMTVEVDGDVVAASVLGSWTFESISGSVRVSPPVGLGLPPEIEVAELVGRRGRPQAVRVWISASAEIRITELVGDVRIVRRDWEVHDAGPVRWSWELVKPRNASGGVLEIETRSPAGSDSARVAYRPATE
jgi:SpoIID/LytB domain protein